jgi:cellulose synthase/poly-beta-1,6-N-acetylglucosamine synthase-like glycosyltransferase
LYNYPERLAYSATPPDFGALLIQRRRWANGGLLILPKLLRFLLRRPYGFQTLVEGMIRLHYLIAIGAASLATLLQVVCPFDKSLDTIWLPLTAVPYYFLYGRDLVKIGYRKSDLLAVYTLNVMLIPIHLGGAFMSLYQAVTSKKIPFGRTPKVKERTCAPKRYILLEFTLLSYCLFACLIDLQVASFVRALYSAVNALVFFAIFTWFIGWKESKEDVFGPGAASHDGTESVLSARSIGKGMLVSKSAIFLLVGLVFLIITLVTTTPLIAN